MQDNYNNNQGKDHFKDIVGSTLHNFEAEPPAGLWNRIEGGLTKRHRRIMLLRTTSIAASLLLLIGLGITWFTTDFLHPSNNKAISDRTTTSKEIRYQPEPNDTKSSSGTKTDNDIQQGTSKTRKIRVPQKDSENRSGVPIKNSERKSVIGTKANIEKPILAVVKTDVNSTTTAESNIDQPAEIKQAAEIALTTPDDTNTGNKKELQHLDSIMKGVDLADLPMEIKLPIINPVEPPAAKSTDPSWSLAMGYGLSSGLDLTQNKEALTDNGSRYSHDDFTASLANGTSYFEEIENTIHDAPLAFGITVDKRIARRLSVETGIMYTRLGFTVKTDDMSSFYRKYRNELYYLGVPVGLRYSFVERKRFDLYALQWLVLEKGISGKWYVDTYTNNVITETESTNHTIRGIQLSTITGLGGEIKLVGKFYLFGQGGVQVFYLNETQPYNIRSSRVAWPSFQAGLRIGL